MLPLFEAAVYVCEYSWFWDWSRNMCNEWGYGTLYHWDDYLILHSKRVDTKNIKIKEVHVFRKIITMTKFIMLLVMYTPTKQKPNKSSHVDFMLIYRKRSRRQPWMAWGSLEHPSSKRLWYPWARRFPTFGMHYTGGFQPCPWRKNKDGRQTIYKCLGCWSRIAEDPNMYLHDPTFQTLQPHTFLFLFFWV